MRRPLGVLTVALITTATLVGCSPPIDGKAVTDVATRAARLYG